MTDFQIDELLKRRRVVASADFSARAVSGILSDARALQSLDSAIDGRLSKYPVEASRSFSARALKFVLEGGHGSLVCRFVSALASVSAVAACVAVAFAVVPSVERSALSEDDFAQMSAINSELYALANLIAEQEVLDTF